jgi:Trypsin-co-occurring domain 1
MAHLVEFPLEGGKSIVVELDDEQLGGFAPAAVKPGEVMARASESFESAIDRLAPALEAISSRMRRLAPDECSVAVGVKLTAESGVIIAKAAGEANFTVTLKWS